MMISHIMVLTYSIIFFEKNWVKIQQNISNVVQYSELYFINETLNELKKKIFRILFNILNCIILMKNV